MYQLLSLQAMAVAHATDQKGPVCSAHCARVAFTYGTSPDRRSRRGCQTLCITAWLHGVGRDEVYRSHGLMGLLWSVLGQGLTHCIHARGGRDAQLLPEELREVRYL